MEGMPLCLLPNHSLVELMYCDQPGNIYHPRLTQKCSTDNFSTLGIGICMTLRLQQMCQYLPHLYSHILSVITSSLKLTSMSSIICIDFHSDRHLSITTAKLQYMNVLTQKVRRRNNMIGLTGDKYLLLF